MAMETGMVTVKEMVKVTMRATAMAAKLEKAKEIFLARLCFLIPRTADGAVLSVMKTSSVMTVDASEKIERIARWIAKRASLVVTRTAMKNAEILGATKTSADLARPSAPRMKNA